MFALPPPLIAGDLAAVVAPSGPLVPGELWSGLAWLRARYRLEMSAGALGRQAYLAGSDVRRAHELSRAMTHRDAKAIVVARGGYGALRIVDDLPWDAFARSPKWLVGYSDATVLHATAWRMGVASVHGPNVTRLGTAMAPIARAAWIASLERPTRRHDWSGLRVVRAGEATGPIVGGNLSILCAMAAAGRLWLPQGAVVAVEDVNESPYRVDRMLTSLRLGGYLDRAAALVFGDFDRCGPGPDGRSVDDVIDERTEALGIPVLAGAPFGHGSRNQAFVLGASASVRNGVVELGTAG
jgi:muramoyltetrapeptide carboxypeptidase